MKTTKVIIADNQPLTAFAIENMVRKIDSDVQIEYVSTSRDLTLRLKESREGVAVILDYTLFDFANEEQLILLADANRGWSNWLLLSDELTSEFLRYVLYNSENIGVAYKDASFNVLCDALRYTLTGERYIAQHATDVLLRKVSKEEHIKYELTQTEREVLKLIAQGKTTKEIAAERFSSIHTINSHRKNIFRKLNVNCAHDAMKYALRSGLVDETEFYI